MHLLMAVHVSKNISDVQDVSGGPIEVRLLTLGKGPTDGQEYRNRRHFEC